MLCHLSLLPIIIQHNWWLFRQLTGNNVSFPYFLNYFLVFSPQSSTFFIKVGLESKRLFSGKWSDSLPIMPMLYVIANHRLTANDCNVDVHTNILALFLTVLCLWQCVNMYCAPTSVQVLRIFQERFKGVFMKFRCVKKRSKDAWCSKDHWEVFWGAFLTLVTVLWVSRGCLEIV